jgi:hypothetical protein
MTNSSQDPKRWSEARTARLIAMVVSGAVVVADLWLLLVYLRAARSLPGGWRAYWYIPFGIAGIMVFALMRFRRHWRAFKAEEPTDPS